MLQFLLHRVPHWINVENIMLVVILSLIVTAWSCNGAGNPQKQKPPSFSFLLLFPSLFWVILITRVLKIVSWKKIWNCKRLHQKLVVFSFVPSFSSSSMMPSSNCPVLCNNLVFCKFMYNSEVSFLSAIKFCLLESCYLFWPSMNLYSVTPKPSMS